MAQKLNLNNYKASGVYTVEIDESSNLSLPLSTGKLVIGSSKKGPINSVVLVNDTRTLTAVYGEIDNKLEKNGSFFHRTIDVALRQGPVYALNVLPVTEGDKAFFRTFNTESASNNSTWSESSNASSMSNFYNSQKLWFADIDAVNKYKNIELDDDYIASPTFYGEADRDANKILTMVNLSKKDITTWIRIADTTGYDISVKDYYKLLGDTAEVPEFLSPDDIIADFFVEIIVVEGDWTDNLKLANDPVYSQYFTTTGIIDAKIGDFVSIKEVTLVAKVQGSIIPEFKDLTGTTVSIDALFNRRFAQSGIYCAIDYKKIDLMDLTNGSFSSGSSTEPISEQRLDLIGSGVDELNSNTTDLDVITEENLYTVDDDTADTTDVHVHQAVNLIDVLSYKKPVSSEFYFELESITADSVDTTYSQGDVYIVTEAAELPVTNTIIATEGSKLYKAWANGFVKNGDYLKYSSTTLYLATTGEIKTKFLVKYIVFEAYSDSTRTVQVNAEKITANGVNFLWIQQAVDEDFLMDFDLSDTDYFVSYSYLAPNKLIFTVDPTLYGNTAKGESATANLAKGIAYDATKRLLVDSYMKVGQYIKAKIKTDANGDPLSRNRMLQIKSVYAQKVPDITGGPSNVPGLISLKYTITLSSPSDPNILGINFESDTTIRAYKGIKKYITSLAGAKIPAMNLSEVDLYPNGTAARQNDILDFLFDSSNLATTLADNETVDFRYIIDSFEGQIQSGSKQQLAQLAANHGKALAICNAPSFAQYERSVDPSFIDFTTRLVSTEAISTGGDLTSNPSFTFGFATGDKGGIAVSTYSAYFMPNVVIFENGKNKSIPPAMYVANTFMRKYTSGNTFSIVAGKNGILAEPEISGLEYDLTNDDRAYLEPAGFNLIVRRRGFGIMIFSNNTGFQRVRSALNNIHVREALVTIERDVERILLNFLFEFNDATTRMRVKTLVKNYLSAVQEARGIASAEVIFDDSNNGVEVLENNAGIIDIIVDFPRGIHKFINRITITRAGGQLASSSSGFTPSF
jgi:hypothetical protein